MPDEINKNDPDTKMILCPAHNEYYLKLAQMIGIKFPMYISHWDVDSDKLETIITIKFHREARFSCPVCGEENLKVYNRFTRRAKTLGFYNYRTVIKFHHPRIKCPNCGLKSVALDWITPGASITNVVKAKIIALLPEMRLSDISRQMNVSINLVRNLMQESAKKRSKKSAKKPK
ncbi:MAG: transposase family protein [Deltaproteobacteria bacterium]|jgi:transposase-like protein|nr:transposase family protein [Deltaproteobacteria bacterium]